VRTTCELVTAGHGLVTPGGSRPRAVTAAAPASLGRVPGADAAGTGAPARSGEEGPW
jgi:hypothetical protein